MRTTLRAGLAGHLPSKPAVVFACLLAASCGGGSTPPSGKLWYAGSAVCGLTNAQIQASASANPAIIVSTSALAAISDVALDAKGNAWVVGTGSDNLFRLPAGALETGGSAAPDLVIRSSALKNPGNLAFDGAGALWVANRQGSGTSTSSDGSIVRFDIPGGVTGMQDLTPTAQIISATAGDLFQIGNIAFDAAQNLWVTSFIGLLRFDEPRSESGAVALAPGAVIEKTGYKDDIYFYSVAFDTSGALWAASSDGLHYLTSVTEFKDPESLKGRSSPAAAATITGGKDILPAGGLAFDVSGNLWMATGESILMYSGPHALSGTVKPAPAISIQLAGQASPATNTHLLFFPSTTDSVVPQAADAAAPDAASADAAAMGKN